MALCFWRPIACVAWRSPKRISIISVTRFRKNAGCASRQSAVWQDVREIRTSCVSKTSPTSTRSSARWRILNAATVDDVASFFKTYYAPNNAVLTIVGDVNAATAIEHVRKYFETIPMQSPPPPVDALEPPESGTAPDRRRSAGAPHANQHRVPHPFESSPDDDTLDLLADILATGRSSRFYEYSCARGSSRSTSAPSPATAAARVFSAIVATVPPDKTSDDVRRASKPREIERLKAGPIADWEIEKSRNAALAPVRRHDGQRSVIGKPLLGEQAQYTAIPARSIRAIDRVAKLKMARMCCASRNSI